MHSRDQDVTGLLTFITITAHGFMRARVIEMRWGLEALLEVIARRRMTEGLGAQVAPLPFSPAGKDGEQGRLARHQSGANSTTSPLAEVRIEE